MKNSKKGVTLVELVICCAILVMLGGACTAVLTSGAQIFNSSAQTANAQMDAEVLQNFMVKVLPSANNPITNYTLSHAKAMETGTAIYVDDDVLIIQINGTPTSINSIKELKYSFIKAGDADSTNAKTLFAYTATLINGKTLDGGFIMSNVDYSSSFPVDVLASKQPVCFGDNQT